MTEAAPELGMRRSKRNITLTAPARRRKGQVFRSLADASQPEACHIIRMVETIYRVVRHTGGGGSGFYVEVTKLGEPLRRTDNFLTMAAAYSWIDRAKEQEQVPVEPARPWWRVLYRRRRSA